MKVQNLQAVSDPVTTSALRASRVGDLQAGLETAALARPVDGFFFASHAPIAAATLRRGGVSSIPASGKFKVAELDAAFGKSDRLSYEERISAKMFLSRVGLLD